MKIQTDDLKVLVIEEEAIDYYIDFINLIKRTMDYPEYLGDFSESDLIHILNINGIILMYRYGNITASSCMMIPARSDDIKKMGLKLDSDKVMDYGPMAVFDDYRGNKIQKYMIRQCDKLSKDFGYKYAVTTVHPDNIYSIHNIEESGFSYVGEVEFSRGKRKVYQKTL